MKKLIALLCLISFAAPVFAGDFDTEDVAAESDAALADNKAVKENLAKEKADAERAHKAADEVRQSAQARRQAAIDEMTRNQNEIQNLTAEQAKIKAEVEKMNQETAVAQKTLQESKVKLEKAKAELQALHQLRSETNKKMVDIAAETDKVALELKALDAGKKQENSDFQQLKEDAKAADEQLTKMKDELSQKQAQAAIAKSNAAAEAAAATPPDSTPAVSASPEMQRAPSSVASTAPFAQTANEMTLKKDCKIYDRMTRGPQVLGVKYNGTSIVKTDESRYWIGFLLTPDQKGYVAKTCF